MPQNEIHLILLWPELFKKKNTAIPWNYSVFGAPEGIRTPGLTLRRGALYPAELLTQVSNTEKEYAVGRRCRLVKGRMAFSC